MRGFLSTNLRGEFNVWELLLFTNWVLRKLSIKRKLQRHTKEWARESTCTFSRSGFRSTKLSERRSRHFSGAPLSQLALQRSFGSDASQRRRLRDRKCMQLWEHSKGEWLFIAKAWEEALIIWPGLCIKFVFSFLYWENSKLCSLKAVQALSHPSRLMEIHLLANKLLAKLTEF